MATAGIIGMMFCSCRKSLPETGTVPEEKPDTTETGPPVIPGQINDPGIAYLWDESISRGQTTIKTTHDEIARNIGSAREVVTKVLNYFAEEGVVTLGRGRIEIADKEKLKTYL